ncbi:MAG: hypothetical protein ABI831_14355 [Betaproteobacteria bacterium]
MKDTILNSIVIAAAFSAILFVSVGDLRATAQTLFAKAPQAPYVAEMAKTVVAAKRLPSDAMLVAAAVE